MRFLRMDAQKLQFRCGNCYAARTIYCVFTCFLQGGPGGPRGKPGKGYPGLPEGSLGHLGGNFGSLGVVLGYLRPSWGHLGPSGGNFGAILGHFGASWGYLGASLEPSCGHLGPSWGYLGPDHPNDSKTLPKVHHFEVQNCSKSLVFGIPFRVPFLADFRVPFRVPFGWTHFEVHVGSQIGPGGAKMTLKRAVKSSERGEAQLKSVVFPT
jgi:hypothetical protein